MTKIFIFDLRMSDRWVGSYGAFDESETAAKIRVEGFFQNMGPMHKVTATLLKVESVELHQSLVTKYGFPIIDRRKEIR